MKPKQEYTRCEYCDSIIELQSPPSNKRYENAEIEIKDGVILFPQRVVEANKKNKKGDSHATSLAGYYCTPRCFIKMLKKLLPDYI